MLFRKIGIAGGKSEGDGGQDWDKTKPHQIEDGIKGGKERAAITSQKDGS